MFDNSNQNKKTSLKKNLKTSTDLLITTFLTEVPLFYYSCKSVHRRGGVGGWGGGGG